MRLTDLPRSFEDKTVCSNCSPFRVTSSDAAEMWNHLTVASTPFYHIFLSQLTKTQLRLTYRRVFRHLNETAWPRTAPIFFSSVGRSANYCTCAHVMAGAAAVLG